MSSLSIPPVPTSPQQDAIQLHKAFKGFGCDTAKVVDIIAHRDGTQRALIQHEYRTMYSTELTKRLSSELSGDLKRAVLLWMYDPAGRDATIVRQALSEDTLDLKAATEVICSRTSTQIQVFKQAYLAIFGAYLENDLNFHATGDHLKLLLTYVSITRYEGPEVDPAMVEKDAKDLYKAGEKKWGTDEKTFIRIFSERSRPHMAAVSVAYNQMYGHSLKKAVKSETSGLFEEALLTILRCAENPAKYFAKGLRKAMKGMGTNDTMLIRIVVSRTEIDMQYIKTEYHKKFGKSLGDAIHSETSGQYRAFLLALVGHNQ
ncbi:annexin D5-like [Magnolia sinica]|uniref:annexin D5-like n=1 Tax=Magnolia sinica TaxID=86752 RepID=UPI0026594775|nr:annexin D5-like [Magnolia sinica]